MSVFQVSGVALLGCVVILFLKELRPGLVPPVRICASVVLVTAALWLYVPVLARVGSLLDECGAGEFASVLMRALGISLICEICALFCRDLGEQSVASGVLLFGKIEILVLCLPLVDLVLEIAKELLEL